MVVLFYKNKGASSRSRTRWLHINRKLKETVDAVANQSQTSTPARLNELLPPPNHHQQLPEITQEPSESLQIQANAEADKVEEGPKLPEFEWVISIKERLNQAKHDDVAGTWAKLCIYKVPQYLREGDDKAYVPTTVSLGPYHHAKKRLRTMDGHKWRSFHQIVERTGQDIKLYLDSIKELEEKARACYEGPISLSSNEFVEMMVLDGCFVLELFQGAAGGFKELGYSPNDPVFAMRGSMHSILRDMIMLENQIPLFILDRLLGLQFRQPNQKGLVAELALSFFNPLMPTDEDEPLTKIDRNRLEWKSEAMSNSPLADHGGLHCLDVFRQSLFFRAPYPKIGSHSGRRIADKHRQQLILCATKLKDAGIKFKKKKTDRICEIEFNNGVLKIPRLLIHDGSKSLFLNLIAFEQCHLNSNNEFTSYIIFMKNLINSHADVAYLHYCGIIEHWLGSEAEVADLFDKLCEEVVFDINDSYLSRLSERVNSYCHQRWNAWRASLKHVFWAITSLFGAAMLLVMTFAQTFYSIYGYYNNPPS